MSAGELESRRRGETKPPCCQPQSGERMKPTAQAVGKSEKQTSPSGAKDRFRPHTSIAGRPRMNKKISPKAATMHSLRYHPMFAKSMQNHRTANRETAHRSKS